MLKWNKGNKMRKILYFLMMVCLVSSCASKTYYKVFFDGNLIEDRYYVKGRLESVVAYNLSDTKDSIVYNGKLECFHRDNNEYIDKNAYLLEKFYHPDFDKSLRNNYIYKKIKSHTLLESTIWSLATLDDEISNDSTHIYGKRLITEDVSNCKIEYYNINTQCVLYDYLFQTYNSEILKKVILFVNDGVLKRILFVGENTNKTVLFEYKNNVLCKEKIFYYKNGVEKYNEAFTYVKGGA
jgi:hypothetical protein